MAQSSWKEKATRLQKRVAAGREKATEMVGTLLQTAEVGGAGFGFSYMRGRMGEAGELDIAGLPVSLSVGLVGHLLGFAGFFGKQSEHVHNIADGAISEYAVHTGYRLGERAKGGAVSQGYRRMRQVNSPGLPSRGSYDRWGAPTMASRVSGSQYQ